MTAALLSYEEASSLLLARANELRRLHRPVEHAALAAAFGRVLAEPVLADRDQPPFARSTRDGYACRAGEAAAHSWLPVAGTTRAGQAPDRPLAPGVAWEIMTGAPVPDGADAVVMLEHVESAEGQIRLVPSRTVGPGENIVPRAAEARQGDPLLAPGARLVPANIAVAASCGYAVVPVFARPRVAILTTGDELIPVDAAPGPGQIRNSNAPMLAALVSAAGGRPLILPTAADNAEALDFSLSQAATADLLLISGGVSAGKFDLVEEALARAGAAFHFTGVRIQPGKPVAFGELTSNGQNGSDPHGGDRRIQPFFGLPGNPISSAVTFLLFAAPVLAALAGNSELGPRFALAKLGKHCDGKPGLTRFVPANCTFGSGAVEFPSVSPVGSQGSGDLAAFARSNCFLVVPEGAEGIASGETVRILLS